MFDKLQDFYDDWVLPIMLFSLVCSAIIVVGWFIYKIAWGVIFLFDKIIDKI